MTAPTTLTGPTATRLKITYATLRNDNEELHAAFEQGIARARADWGHRQGQQRVTVLRRAADLISERQMELAALMAMEVGKNRLEALGDVEETADLIRYYCDQMEINDGFHHAMGNLGDSSVHTRSVLKPHGVWAVISPFNFPLALSGGPASGAPGA